MNMTIKEKVKQGENVLKKMTSHEDLKDWAYNNGMNNKSAFPIFKKTLVDLEINDYEKLKGNHFNSLIPCSPDYEVTMYSDAKLGKNRFGITDVDGNPLWFGKFFHNDYIYKNTQTTGELSAASKAVWLASKIKEELAVESIQINLYVDAEWLTYQQPHNKGFLLTKNAKKFGVILNINWVSGVNNPADKYTICDGFKKWSDNNLEALANRIGNKLEVA